MALASETIQDRTYNADILFTAPPQPAPPSLANVFAESASLKGGLRLRALMEQRIEAAALREAGAPPRLVGVQPQGGPLPPTRE